MITTAEERLRLVLDELPEYPCPVSDMTARELEISFICSYLVAGIEAALDMLERDRGVGRLQKMQESIDVARAEIDRLLGSS